MRKSQLIFSAFLAILGIFLNTVSFAEPANLSLLKQEIEAYHDSGIYQKELAEAITQARDFITNRVRSNARSAYPQKLAIVLDIDETSLSNYNNLASHGFIVTHTQWHEDINASNGLAIRPMLSLFDDALKQGVSVFFVTGRTESERAATIKNLKQAGFHDWANLYLKPEQYNQPSVVPFKSQTRANIAKLGYTVVASIGDQESDLKGGNAERTFKLPNPYYYIP